MSPFNQPFILHPSNYNYVTTEIKAWSDRPQYPVKFFVQSVHTTTSHLIIFYQTTLIYQALIITCVNLFITFLSLHLFLTCLSIFTVKITLKTSKHLCVMPILVRVSVFLFSTLCTLSQPRLRILFIRILLISIRLTLFTALCKICKLLFVVFLLLYLVNFTLPACFIILASFFMLAVFVLSHINHLPLLL